MTEDLKNWINSVRSAFTPEQIFDELVKAGWQAEVAQAAVETTLGVNLAQKPTGLWPNLNGKPNTLMGNNSSVSVLMTTNMPKSILFGNFMSALECNEMIELAKPKMSRSTVANRQQDVSDVSTVRTSNGMFFARGETPLIETVERRISDIFGCPVQNGEGMQVLQYLPGALYEPHHDFFSIQDPSSASRLSRGGNRIATLIIYLNDVPSGGGTTFPDVGIEICPKQGNAIFFGYPTPTVDTLTLHGGSPVVTGEKWVCVKWLREREFN